MYIGRGLQCHEQVQPVVFCYADHAVKLNYMDFDS